MLAPVIDDYLMFRLNVVAQFQHQALLTERAIGIPSEHCIGPLLNAMEVVDEAGQLGHDLVLDDVLIWFRSVEMQLHYPQCHGLGCGRETNAQMHTGACTIA